MPEILETQCPHCHKLMKLKSRKALGKQAPCPKCKKPFLVKELPSDAVEDYEVDEYDTGDPTVDHDVEYYDDDAHDDYDDFDDEPRRRSKKRPSKKRRKKKANWVKPTLIISGSVVGVALLGLGIWLVWGMFNKKLELAWLPPDASTISVKRPASTWNRSILGTRYDSEKANLILEKERELWGVTQRDIVSITSGGNRSGENITVVRASADLVPETILKNAADYEKADHNGNTYYRVGAVVLFFPDDRTAVIGSEDSVKKAIDRGPEPAKREDLDFVNASYENVAVSTSNNSVFAMSGFVSETRPDITVIAGNGGTSSSKRIIQGKFSTESAAISAHEKAELKLKEAIDEWESTGRAKKRERLQKPISYLPAEYRYTEDEIEDALKCEEREMNSASITRSGTIVTISMTHYVTKHSKRVAEERRAKDTNFDAERIAKSWGYSTFKFSSRSAPTFRPGRTGRTNTNRNSRVMKITMRYQSFSGRGDVKAALARATARVPGLDSSRNITDEASKTVTVFSMPGKGSFVLQSSIRGSMMANGFRSVRLSGAPTYE